MRTRGCARLLAAVLLLAPACFSLTSPTQASARQVTGGETYSGSPALLFAAGWSRSEQSGVWMINADGSGLRRLAPIGSEASWSPDGRLIDESEWNGRVGSWLPTDDDAAFVASLMTPAHRPGEMAGWIAPPANGIHQKPVEYEYVRAS